MSSSLAASSPPLPNNLPPHPCPLPRSHSWVPTPGHSPGHVSFLHEPSGTLVAGDAIFEVIPSVSWASGIEAVVTKPLGMVAGSAARLAAAPARAVLGGLLGGRAVSAALNSTMGALSTERLFSGAVSGGWGGA